MKILISIIDFFGAVLIFIIKSLVRFLFFKLVKIRSRYSVGDVFKSNVSGIVYTIKRHSIKNVPFPAYEVEYFKPLRFKALTSIFPQLPRQIIVTELFLKNKELIILPKNGFFNRLVYGWRSNKVRGKSLAVPFAKVAPDVDGK